MKFYSFQVIFSSSKNATALVVATLVDKGLLDYSEKISQYWPEFACNGKENMILADLLKHQVSPFTKLCFSK